jgi:N-acetylglucosaminyldiphosphoundecaprenol N-acetyl-beta-D-mannosaminyltransferase
MRLMLMGIPIDAVTRAEATTTLRRFLDEPREHFVTTPNPEMLVDALHDRAFTEALQSSDLAIPDGHGLVFVAALKGKRIPERVTGTDIVQDIAAIAAEQGRTVFLLGGLEGEGAAAAEALKSTHPGLRIVGTLQCGALTRGKDGAWTCPDSDVVGAIRSAAPDILLVAFGHPKQETWIRANLAGLPSVRVAIGIGGAFNFLAGRAKRAPAWMRRIWLEWLWRLIQEPHRIGRILKAAIVFPCLALTSKD